MAVLKNGVFGTISGKLGNVVYVNRKGINYIRSKPTSIKKSPSAAQMGTRMKFVLVFVFLKPFKPVLIHGFNHHVKGKTPFNLAMSYHLKNAVTGSYPDFKIQYKDALLTKGPLPNPIEPFMVKANHNIIAFYWKCFDNNPNDLAVLIAYSESQKKVIHEVSPASRTHQIAFLTIPGDCKEHPLHCWMAFKSPITEKYSDSVYLGTIQL